MQHLLYICCWWRRGWTGWIWWCHLSSYLIHLMPSCLLMICMDNLSTWCILSFGRHICIDVHVFPCIAWWTQSGCGWVGASCVCPPPCVFVQNSLDDVSCLRTSYIASLWSVISHAGNAFPCYFYLYTTVFALWHLPHSLYIVPYTHAAQLVNDSSNVRIQITGYRNSPTK